VEWARGNALEPRTYDRLLPGALAAISCVGGFGSQSEMQRINGAANAAVIAAAKAAGVQRFVYVSAHTPNVPGIDLLLAGYIQVRWAAGGLEGMLMLLSICGGLVHVDRASQRWCRGSFCAVYLLGPWHTRKGRLLSVGCHRLDSWGPGGWGLMSLWEWRKKLSVNVHSPYRV
jgi:hypothetical protein